METTFENANVGDRVWWYETGSWGVITIIKKFSDFPIEVKFLEGKRKYEVFTVGGTTDLGLKQVLFWDAIKIEAPPRPKLKVKKVLEGWVNVYPASSAWHDTKGDAEHEAGKSRIACVHIVQEYEVEE